MPPRPPAVRLWLLAVLTVVTGCRRGGIAGTGAPCTVDDNCRTGYHCVAQLDMCAPDEPQPAPDAADADGGPVTDGRNAQDQPGDLGTDTAVVEAGQPSWSPGALPGLVLWLDAGSGVVMDGAAVARWTDRSGRGNDARQDVASMRPTVSTDGGHPVLVFRAGGAPLRVSDNAALRWGTDDFSVFLVASLTNSPWSPALFIRKESASYPYVGWILDTTDPGANEVGAGRLCGQLRYRDVRVCSTETGHDDGALVMFGVQRAGGRLSVRVNGRPSGDVAVPELDVSAAGQDLFIGGHGFQPNFQLQGTIAEIVAVHGAMSAGDREALERHLLAKYGLH